MQDMIEIHPFLRPGFGPAAPETTLTETLEQELREAHIRLLKMTLRMGTGPLDTCPDLIESRLENLQTRQRDFQRRLDYLKACGQAHPRLMRLNEKYGTLLQSYSQLLEITGLLPYQPCAS